MFLHSQPVEQKNEIKINDCISGNVENGTALRP